MKRISTVCIAVFLGCLAGCGDSDSAAIGDPAATATTTSDDALEAIGDGCAKDKPCGPGLICYYPNLSKSPIPPIFNPFTLYPVGICVNPLLIPTH
jgi:hypothetical protein